MYTKVSNVRRLMAVTMSNPRRKSSTDDTVGKTELREMKMLYAPFLLVMRDLQQCLSSLCVMAESLGSYIWPGDLLNQVRASRTRGQRSSTYSPRPKTHPGGFFGVLGIRE